MSNHKNEGEDEVTETDLKEAKERWADPKHEGSVKELFSAPVYGDGFRGDVPIERKPESA